MGTGEFYMANLEDAVAVIYDLVKRVEILENENEQLSTRIRDLEEFLEQENFGDMNREYDYE